MWSSGWYTNDHTIHMEKVTVSVENAQIQVQIGTDFKYIPIFYLLIVLELFCALSI